MYILELIAKKIKEKDKKQYASVPLDKVLPDYEACNHTFSPLDSTGETLACTKCGKIIKNNTFMYKSKNPFS